MHRIVPLVAAGSKTCSKVKEAALGRGVHRGGERAWGFVRGSRAGLNFPPRILFPAFPVRVGHAGSQL